MVTQKNPDENVNHLPSAAPCVTDNTTLSTASSADVIDANKRYFFYALTSFLHVVHVYNT